MIMQICYKFRASSRITYEHAPWEHTFFYFFAYFFIAGELENVKISHLLNFVNYLIKKLAFRYSSCKSERMRDVGVASWLLLPLLLPWSSHGLPAELDTYPLTKERAELWNFLQKNRPKRLKPWRVQIFFLCTGGASYALFISLLISKLFCTKGERGPLGGPWKSHKTHNMQYRMQNTEYTCSKYHVHKLPMYLFFI